MAQRLIFFKDHLRAALTMGTTRAQHERNLHPSHRRGSPHRRREPLCARKRTFSCDFNHPDITRTKRWKQPCQCKMQAWITKHTGSAAEIFQRSPPRSVPPIDAGSHFMRENTLFRAISNTQTSLGQSVGSRITKHNGTRMTFSLSVPRSLDYQTSFDKYVYAYAYVYVYVYEFIYILYISIYFHLYTNSVFIAGFPAKLSRLRWSNDPAGGLQVVPCAECPAGQTWSGSSCDQCTAWSLIFWVISTSVGWLGILRNVGYVGYSTLKNKTDLKLTYEYLRHKQIDKTKIWGRLCLFLIFLNTLKHHLGDGPCLD